MFFELKENYNIIYCSEIGNYSYGDQEIYYTYVKSLLRNCKFNVYNLFNLNPIQSHNYGKVFTSEDYRPIFKKFVKRFKKISKLGIGINKSLRDTEIALKSINNPNMKLFVGGKGIKVPNTTLTLNFDNSHEKFNGFFCEGDSSTFFKTKINRIDTSVLGTTLLLEQFINMYGPGTYLVDTCRTLNKNLDLNDIIKIAALVQINYRELLFSTDICFMCEKPHSSIICPFCTEHTGYKFCKEHKFPSKHDCNFYCNELYCDMTQKAHSYNCIFCKKKYCLNHYYHINTCIYFNSPEDFFFNDIRRNGIRNLVDTIMIAIVNAHQNRYGEEKLTYIYTLFKNLIDDVIDINDYNKNYDPLAEIEELKVFERYERKYKLFLQEI